jgi:hypothetical protein
MVPIVAAKETRQTLAEKKEEEDGKKTTKLQLNSTLIYFSAAQCPINTHTCSHPHIE